MAKAVTNLVNPAEDIASGNDNIVIVDVFESVRGGRTLDVENYKPDVIRAGHVIIKETATGEYKPMPVDDDGIDYDELPTGHAYAGILINTVLKKRPMAGILVRGTVNYKAAPYPMGTIMVAVKAALPLINFRED